MRSRSSSVRLPHCSLTLPFISFHLPFRMSLFIAHAPSTGLDAAIMLFVRSLAAHAHEESKRRAALKLAVLSRSRFLSTHVPVIVTRRGQHARKSGSPGIGGPQHSRPVGVPLIGGTPLAPKMGA